MDDVSGRGSAGQASIELLAALPALLVAGLMALQLLAAGYALTLADGAAEAGALAVAAGRPVAGAVRDSLPGWAEDEIGISVDGGRVTVRLRPPSPFPAIADRLAVTSSAAARPKSLSTNPSHNPPHASGRRRIRRGAASSVGRIAPDYSASLRPGPAWSGARQPHTRGYETGSK